MVDVALQTAGLSKHFGRLAAVEDLDLSVYKGEIFGFLGPNGAGKTTTISMVLGLLHPTSGNIELLGHPVSPSHTAPLRRVGALVGAPGFVPHLSARDNLRMLATLDPNVTKARVEEVLEQVGMSGAAARKFKGFSTGMKQRLGLGAALLHRPDLLILDEPTNGLDPAGMREIRELLRSLAEQGVTVFLSSHLLHEVEQVCDRVAVLNHGRLVTQGTVAELLGGRGVVRVRVPSPPDAARVLESLPGVGQIHTNAAYLEVEDVPSESVILHLVKNGIVPSEVTKGRSNLESIFLELTDQAA